MRKIITGVTLIASIFMMSACGGGGDTAALPEMDNSKVGAIEIFDGYYAGDNVLFAGVPIVGSWRGLQPEVEGSSSVLLVFEDDGDAQIQNDRSYSYGVSKDGMEVRLLSFIIPTTIKYKGTRPDYIEYIRDGISTTYDCYDVEWHDNYGIYDVVICPS